MGAWSEMDLIWALGVSMIGVVLLFGTTGIYLGITMLRALRVRGHEDERQGLERSNFERRLSEIQLDVAEKDQAHHEKCHQIEMSMMKCRQEQCAAQATREEMLGTSLQFQRAIEKTEAELRAGLSEVHRRVDEKLGVPDSMAKNGSR